MIFRQSQSLANCDLFVPKLEVKHVFVDQTRLHRMGTINKVLVVVVLEARRRLTLATNSAAALWPASLDMRRISYTQTWR